MFPYKSMIDDLDLIRYGSGEGQEEDKCILDLASCKSGHIAVSPKLYNLNTFSSLHLYLSLHACFLHFCCHYDHPLKLSNMAIPAITLSNLAAAGLTAVVIYVTAVVWYRLQLHPLSHIPGPKLAAMTWLYEIYHDMILPGQYVFKIQELHKQYGPVIRVTPNEVHVNDLQYLDDIYAGPTQVRQKPVTGNLEIAGSLAGTADFYLHKKRRKAMGAFFSKSAIARIEDRIRAKIDKLCQIISVHAEDHSVMNLSDLFYGLAWDVVFEYCFGIEADLLANEINCAQVRHSLQTLLQGVNINKHLPWVAKLGKLPIVGKYFVPPGIFEMVRINNLVGANIKAVEADTDRKFDSSKRSIFYQIRDDRDLPAVEKSFHRLRREGSFLVLAGTESTAASMKITMFHILHNPSILARVRSELDTMPADASTSALESLPYFSACIHEGNRLSWGITVRNTRLSPDPMDIGRCTLPPYTLVSTTSLAVSGNPNIFPNPWTFNPDRWLGSQGAVSRKYEFAFGRGARKCIGMNLALAELFLTLAAVLRKFDFVLFETDLSDVQFKHDYQVAHPRLDSKGVRATVRSREGST